MRENMGRRVSDMEELKWKWEQRMHSPEFNELTRKQQALEIGVAPETVSRWHEKASPAFWENVAKTIRNQYSRYIPEVDRALLRAADKGNVAAIELVYKRHEGWSPTQRNENINKNADLEGKTDEELQMELLRKADPALLRKVLEEKKAPDLVGIPEDEYVGEKESHG
jgi:hypothetical protein